MLRHRWLRNARADRRALWVILDGEKEIGTGVGEDEAQPRLPHGGGGSRPGRLGVAARVGPQLCHAPVGEQHRRARDPGAGWTCQARDDGALHARRRQRPARGHQPTRSAAAAKAAGEKPPASPSARVSARSGKCIARALAELGARGELHLTVKLLKASPHAPRQTLPSIAKRVQQGPKKLAIS